MTVIEENIRLRAELERLKNSLLMIGGHCSFDDSEYSSAVNARAYADRAVKEKILDELSRHIEITLTRARVSGKMICTGRLTLRV